MTKGRYNGRRGLAGEAVKPTQDHANFATGTLPARAPGTALERHALGTGQVAFPVRGRVGREEIGRDVALARPGRCIERKGMILRAGRPFGGTARTTVRSVWTGRRRLIVAYDGLAGLEAWRRVPAASLAAALPLRKTSATAWFLYLSARSSGVLPCLPQAFGSAPASRSAATTAGRGGRKSAATCGRVLTRRSRALGSAADRTSATATAGFSFSAAICNLQGGRPTRWNRRHRGGKQRDFPMHHRPPPFGVGRARPRPVSSSGRAPRSPTVTNGRMGVGGARIGSGGGAPRGFPPRLHPNRVRYRPSSRFAFPDRIISRASPSMPPCPVTTSTGRS